MQFFRKINKLNKNNQWRRIGTVPETSLSEEKKVHIFVNGKYALVPEKSTIYEATSLVLPKHQKIPILCHHPYLKPIGICRVCMVQLGPSIPAAKLNATEVFHSEDVEVPDHDAKLIPSCATPITPGMNIWTMTDPVEENTKNILKFILAHHPLDCPTCPANGQCQLQDLLGLYHISPKDLNPQALTQYKAQYRPENQRDHDMSDVLSRLDKHAIEIDLDKCIKCTRCIRVCNEVQDQHILGMIGRGRNEHVGSRFETDGDMSKDLERSCSGCGQCSNFCPVGAISYNDQISEVRKLLRSKANGTSKKILCAQIAPSCRISIGEGFEVDPGDITEGQLVTALKEIGFDHVFDANFAADLTIMEEGSELLQRLKNGGPLPMYTSCCPGWVNIVESTYPELMPNLSTCKSPQGMMGGVVMHYWAQKNGYDPKDVFLIGIMPCTAKKDEAKRPELINDVKNVLTTRELVRLFKLLHVHLPKMPETPFDDPLGQSTGAAILFGATGGVMEAALRTAYELGTGKTLPKLVFEDVRGLQGIKETTIDFDGTPLNIAVVNATRNIHSFIKTMRETGKQYHFIEIMACPSGCIGGGGQPKNVSGDYKLFEKRMKAIYKLDEKNVIRKSHENPSIKKLYEDFLEHPLSHKSHEFLHTHYHTRFHRKGDPEEKK